MTITATWISLESGAPRLWMASDSRITDQRDVLLEEGVKLFEVPISVYRPGAGGFFDQPYFETSVGLACAGSTLIFQQVYATLVPILSNLGGYEALPSLEDMAALVGRLTTTYARSLGAARPHGAKANIVLAGASPVSGSLEAYELSASFDAGGMLAFVPAQVDLTNDHVHYAGDPVAVGEAERLLDSYRRAPLPGTPYHRAALNTIRALIDSPGIPTVGGDLQMAFNVGHRMRRVATMTPIEPGKPQAKIQLNNISTDAIGNVGPCFPTFKSMPSP